MLREVKDARFERRFGIFGRRYLLLEGRTPATVTWRRRGFAAIQLEQDVRPVALFTRAGRTYWAFEQRILWEDDGLAGDDVLALVRQDVSAPGSTGRD